MPISLCTCHPVPADVESTDVKLVACWEGWEYVVHESTQSPHIADSVIKVMVRLGPETAGLLARVECADCLVPETWALINRRAHIREDLKRKRQPAP